MVIPDRSFGDTGRRTNLQEKVVSAGADFGRRQAQTVGHELGDKACQDSRGKRKDKIEIGTESVDEGDGDSS